MNVEKLTCFHFRNYETMSFSFVPKCIHFLYGKNAWGFHCTNLILHLIASVLTGYLCGIFIEKFFYKIKD